MGIINYKVSAMPLSDLKQSKGISAAVEGIIFSLMKFSISLVSRVYISALFYQEEHGFHSMKP